jgi:NAD(P)-dependent dehydrogenase (short-subunit alcohol dehydrogenase family)
MEGLKDKIVAVTGGGQGLGEALADILSGSGAVLALIDRNVVAAEAVARRLADTGVKAKAFRCDIADEGQVEATAAAVREEFGRCDGLVNNAGVVGFMPLEDLTLEEWNRLLSVNLTGTFLCMKHFGRLMLAQGSGSIVTVTSTAASIPQAISGSYSPSKAGAKMLGRLAAVEWGKRGVRSNVVSPGAMFTPMTRPFQDDPVLREKRAAMMALGRISDAHEVAQVIAFLLSDLSSYVTGAHIDADGGLRQMMLSLVPRKGVNTK